MPAEPVPASAELIAGLARPRKRIDGKFLWDDAGSLLFERICASPGYYPSGREFAILRRAAPAIAQACGEGAALVEFGCAGSDKGSTLLHAMRSPRRYVGIDISPAALGAVGGRIRARHPGLEVCEVAADYSRELTLPPGPAGRVLGFFPGIAVGNFDPDAAGEFLSRARRTLGPDSLLLVAIDSTADPATLRAAYADEGGLMAAFHLNLLARLRREAGLDLPADAFRHEIRLLDRPSRVEAHLVATRDLSCGPGDAALGFRRGETVLTGLSFKYEPDAFRERARRAGWSPLDAWDDDRTRISLQLLRA